MVWRRTASRTSSRSAKSNGDFFEGNARSFGGPAFAWLHRHSESQRARRNDLARAQRWVMWIICQQFDQVAQRPQRAVEHERATAALHQLAVAIEFDLKCG